MWERVLCPLESVAPGLDELTDTQIVGLDRIGERLARLPVVIGG